jgi:hypothetical protein
MWVDGFPLWVVTALTIVLPILAIRAIKPMLNRCTSYIACRHRLIIAAMDATERRGTRTWGFSGLPGPQSMARYRHKRCSA